MHIDKNTNNKNQIKKSMQLLHFLRKKKYYFLLDQIYFEIKIGKKIKYNYSKLIYIIFLKSITLWIFNI